MKLLNTILGYVSSDMGIDLGTANTLVYVKGQGIVLREPSVVAIDTDTGDVKAVGDEAKRMVGRTPAHIQAIRPLKDGVIANFDVAEKMIRHFIEKVHNRRSTWVSPRIVIGVPSGITEVEKRAVTESALAAGAREALTIEEPLAAAIGANMPVQEPSGNMVVDIGGGTTEVAVISLGGMVRSASVRVAGDELDDAVTQHIKKVYNLMIGERTAEDIKIQIGSAFPLDEEKTLEIRGRDLISGLPKTITISSEEIREALSEPLTTILSAVKETLEQTPPELASDIMERGILMAGGGALLRGIDKLLSKETGLPVHVAEDPLTCVVLGAGKYLEEMKNFHPL
ncbi:MAG: rod shape-determining protein [Candidatus Lindowbacteria bacterium RIFCSPLOWO2_12_FULL_62_27]|nr:MAG: rod shape-determining protein [Candidatus Lindowbacteria bacterium RIFCSPLOWO2_02_FULL_62_12]OGH60237.1 MAG: rod shape-determining protein [Candidatus Lindowbacteria bacterium RIFCSPLOWO2_12_FULL_62_27]